MSLLRRRMMMASSVKEPDVPDTPMEELDYLTIIPLHEEEVWYYIYPYGGSNDFSIESPVYTQEIPFHYRINRGEWVEVNLPDSDSLAWPVKLNKDTELQLKCMGCNYSFGYAVDEQMFRIYTNGTFNIKGTPMSLLYGDGFKENNYVGDNLFFGLFVNNNGLTQILNPKTFLPYTELGQNCYVYMFDGCTNLINAPVLPAKILAFGCYTGMFYGCQKINYIKMLGEKMRETGDYTEQMAYCFQNWVSGVSSTGTFVKSKDATWDTTPGALGTSGVPAGWTVITEDEEGESPYAFSFNIVTTDGYYEANAEELAILNKGLSIIIELVGGNLDSFEINQDTAPQEFDLRINGVRNFNFYFVDYGDDKLNCYISFNDGVSLYFGDIEMQTSNPVFEDFILIRA